MGHIADTTVLGNLTFFENFDILKIPKSWSHNRHSADNGTVEV